MTRTIHQDLKVENFPVSLLKTGNVADYLKLNEQRCCSHLHQIPKISDGTTKIFEVPIEICLYLPELSRRPCAE